MKIVNANIINKEETIFFLNNLYQVGKIFKGKITEIKGEFVTLVTENGQIISCKTDTLLTSKKNEEIYFQVKSIYDNKIILSILDNEKGQNKYLDYSIKELLKMNGIEPSKYRAEVVKELINFMLPIDKKNVVYSIKTYEKLVKLLNSDDNLKVYSIKPGIEVLDEDISNLIIDKYNDNNFNFDKLDIENKPTNYVDTDKYNVVKVSYLKKMINEAINRNSFQDLIKGIIFLLKSNVKVSLNNIYYLFKILNGENILEEDFNELEFLLLKDNKNKYRNVLKVFNKFNNRLCININNLSKKNNFSKENLEKYLDNIKENIKSLDSLAIKEFNSKEIQKKIREIYNKLNFLRGINSIYGFYYIPFKIDKYNFKENMFFLKKSRINKDKNFKVFINLKTKRLELVKIVCEMKRNNISIDFKIKDKYIDLFKKEEYKLKQVLNDNGFDNIVICYNSSNNRNPIELLVNNNSFNYLFDIRV